MEKSIQIQQLVNSRQLNSKEKYELFEDALQKLHGKIGIEDVPLICQVFYDDTQDDEVMFGIIHLIEQLIGEEYLQIIALCTPNMEVAHDWAMTLNKRIINSQKYYEKYIEVISALEQEDKERILNLLVDVKNDNPKRFGKKIDLLFEKIVQ